MKIHIHIIQDKKIVNKNYQFHLSKLLLFTIAISSAVIISAIYIHLIKR